VKRRRTTCMPRRTAVHTTTRGARRPSDGSSEGRRHSAGHGSKYNAKSNLVRPSAQTRERPQPRRSMNSTEWKMRQTAGTKGGRDKQRIIEQQAGERNLQRDTGREQSRRRHHPAPRATHNDTAETESRTREGRPTR